jgi:hypothetical protein
MHNLTQPCRGCMFPWCQEKAACLSALKAGYGKQYYHMSGPPAKSTDHRVQQRRGQVLVEDKDGWGALVRANVQTCLSFAWSGIVLCFGCGLRVYFRCVCVVGWDWIRSSIIVRALLCCELVATPIAYSMFNQQHRTYDPKDAGSASDYAPFATVEDGGTRVVGPLEETRKLTTTLGVRSRKDMLRARRVIEARCVGLGRCFSVVFSAVCVFFPCVCVDTTLGALALSGWGSVRVGVVRDCTNVRLREPVLCVCAAACLAA